MPETSSRSPGRSPGHSVLASVGTGLAVGAVLDQVVADPRRGHPVAVFGGAAARLERRLYVDSKRAGAVFAGVCVTGALGLGAVVGRAGTSGVALATWAVLGSHSLRAEAQAVHDLLAADDLSGARRRVTHLVGRDPSGLDGPEVARAALESVAENTCDAVIAPLFWGAVAGVPGLLGYRAVNTLDAMVGHRSARYERFGWAAARLDDAANWLPARVGVALTACAARLCGYSSGAAWHMARRDGRRHPSPNSGWGEAAFAGALGVRLGGRNVYGSRVEDRPVLGDGRPVVVADLPRATRLCAVTTAVATLVFASGRLIAARR